MRQRIWGEAAKVNHISKMVLASAGERCSDLQLAVDLLLTLNSTFVYPP